MFLNVVGELDFGRRAMGGSLDMGADLGTLQVEWFKRQLVDDPPAEPDGPRVKLFVQGINRWRDEDDWPLARARCDRLVPAAATAASRPRRRRPTTATTRSCTTRSTRARRAAAIS